MESSGGEQTISPEFLQNIQSAVNSQGVLGQVQVIQTENGPITVLFMEEGADASGIMGDNLTVTIPEGGDGVSETVIQDGNSDVHYQFVESGDDYSHMVSEGVAGISGLEESVVSTGTDQNLGADQTVVDSVNDGGNEADLTGIQSIVDSSVATVSSTGLSGIQTVADIPVEQVSAEALQQAGESTDTYYITDSGQILKIDTSALNLGSSDTLQLLQGEDNSLQVINQGQTVQVVSQAESVEPQRQTETQISYVNVASDTASSSFGTSPNFEYTATRVDNQLVIDTRVEEPKVLSYKTTNRQRTNIMRQPAKSVSQSLLSRSTIVTPGKAAASYKAHGFKTVKETDVHGNTTEVLYPSTSKQKIIIPKLGNQTAYTSVISKGKSIYQPHQMITTMTKPQQLMKSDATQTMVSKLSGTQYVTTKQPASTGQVVYPKKPVVTPVIGRSKVVQSPAMSKSAAADLLSVAMKHADVDHPQSVTISPAVSKTAPVLADSIINSSVAVQHPTSVATTSMSEQQSLSIAQEVLASGLQQLSEVSAASAPTILEMQDDDAQTSTSSDQQHLIPNGELVTDQIKVETPAVGVSSVGTDVDQDFFGFESSEPGEDQSNEELSVKQETSTIETKKTPHVEPKQSAVSSNVEDTVNKKPVKAVEPETPKSVQIKSIDVPDSDVTIQLYADGTLVTRDKSGTNCSQVKLEELGLDMSMLEGNTDIELLIVQGDGKEVRATINTSMHVNPATDSVTKTTETAASKSVASKTAGNLTTPSGATTQTTATSGSKVSHSVEGAPISEARPYKCSMCPRTFKFYRTYRCHEIVHTKAVTFTCHLCQRLFAREVNLQSHLELHKKKGMMKPTEKRQEEVDKDEFRCDECDRVFSAKNGLSRHMREIHHNESIPCPICGKLFASESSLKKHASQHVGPFTCPHCKKVFEQDVEYQEHIKAEHPEEIYTCALCEFVVSSKVAYSNHIKLRHAHVEDLTPFIKDKECCICYSKFETQEQIEKHMNIHKTEKDHACPACNRTYKQMWKLEQHIREMHENGVTFKCTECEDTFGYKGKLDIHMKLFHRGPYQCYTCYEKFPGRNDMEEHQYKDHDIALTCSKCSLIVETSLKLKQHLKEHTSRNYICSSCDAGFEHKSSLKSHLVDKHFAGLKANMLKENPSMCNVNFEVVCDMCGEYFAGRSLYKQHLRDVHFGGDSVIMLELFPSLAKVQDIPDPVSCDHCGKTFLAVHHLNFHMRTHMSKTKKKRRSRAKNSVKERDSEPEDEEDEEVDFTNIEPRETDHQYKCEKCDAEFSRKAALEKHIANRHTKDVFKEALKNIEMEEIERAELEENEGVESTTMSEETPKDDECQGEGTPDGMTPKLGKIKFPAPKTQPKTIFGTKITDGIEIDEKNLKCITCGKTYSQLKNLRKHVTNIHRKKMIKQRIFESSPALNDDGTTQCRKCNKRFDELANLRRHMVQKHRIYLQKDGVESLTKSPLKVTRSGESDEDFEPMDTSLEAGDNSSGDISSFLGMNFNLGKTHSCNIESVKMKQHRCNLCGIRFSREATLKKHLLLHKSSETDAKLDIEDPSDLLPAKYPCKSCGNMYSTALGLIHHNRSKHADVDEVNVLADIDAVDEKTKEESPKKKPTEKQPTKSLKRKLIPDGDELREVAKKKMKIDKEGNETFECKICGSIYYTFKGLSNHERDIHGTKKSPVASPVAQSVRTSMSGRILTKSTRLSELVSCDHCSKTFSEEKHLKLHILRVHNAEIDQDEYVTPSGKGSKLVYHCDVCEQRFSTMSNLNHHMVSVHDEKEDTGEVKKEAVKCDVCNLEFATEKTMAVHKRKHTGEKPYNCCLCNKRFISKYQLECHLKKSHAKLWVRKVKCKICLMLFETETAMLNHKEVHKKPASEEDEASEEEEQSLHECDLCDKTFKWKRNLTSHIETHHKEEDPLTCGVCNKVFPDKESIKKHMVEHKSKKKAYSCDKCDKSFPKEVSLKMHISHMHKSTPGGLSCDICKETFTVKLKLMEHMLTHTSVMPHKCTECSASFKQEFRLKAHMLTHKDTQKKTEKVVEKEKDNKDVQPNDKDVKPSKTTSGGKFKCKRCGKRFEQMVLVKVHIAKAHKSTKTAALPAPIKIGTRSRSTSTSTTASTTDSKPESKKKSAKEPDKKAVSKDSKSSATFKSPKISSAAKDTKTSSSVKSSNNSLADKDSKSTPALKSTKSSYATKETKSSPALKSSSATKDSKSSPSTTHFCKKCKKNFLKADTYYLHMKVMHGQAIEDKNNKDSKEKSDKDQKRTVIMTTKAKELKGKSDKTEIKKKKESISVKVTSPNNCPICKKSFDSRTGLKIHLKTKHKVTVEASPTKSDGHRKKCLYCSDCARVFWSQVQYDTHNKKYHPDKAAVDLDRQVMEAMREVKSEPVDATSPKAADFETIKHKCEFCAQVHYTKKLFDEHMLKEHPEHAAEYGISESRASSKKAPKNLLSVGLYGVNVHNQLLASPVVSLQRMHKSFRKSSSNNPDKEDSYELEFQKFLESEQLSDISDEMPEDLTGDSDTEADSELPKGKNKGTGKSVGTKVASEDNDDLIMEIEEEVEDSGKEGKHVEEKSIDTVEKVNKTSGRNKSEADVEVDEDSENNGIEIVETFSLATSHMVPAVNEENQPVTDIEETESGQTNEQTTAVNHNTDDQDQSLNVETTPEKGIADTHMDVSKEQENIDWAAIDNEIEAVGDDVMKPDDSLVSTCAIESSIERTSADTDVSGIEGVLPEENEDGQPVYDEIDAKAVGVTGSYEELEKDEFALQESISGSTATNVETAGTSQDEESVESLDLNEAEYFQGSVEKGEGEIITASNNNEIQTQDGENYPGVLPSSNGGENIDLDLVEEKNSVYNELDKWDAVKRSVGIVDEQNILETENVEGSSEDVVTTSEVYFEEMDTA